MKKQKIMGINFILCAVLIAVSAILSIVSILILILAVIFVTVVLKGDISLLK